MESSVPEAIRSHRLTRRAGLIDAERNLTLRVGILELLVDSESRTWVDRAYGAHFKRFYCSITPQAVAVWCRQLGHQVSYATFYGQGEPKRLLPGDLDEAIRETEGSELVRAALGDQVFEWFLRNKKAEWHTYHTRVTPFELEEYLPLL